MQTEIIEYNGERFTRYPQSTNRTERVYFSGWVKINGKQTKKRLHWYKYFIEVGGIPKGFHIHHIDENPLNNSIENLQLICGKKHIGEHSKKALATNPIHKAKFHAAGIEAAKVWHKSDAGREWHSQLASRRMSEREYITKKCLVCEKEYKTRAVQSETKFCSNNCKSEYRRRSGVDNIKAQCIVCGCEFIKNKYSAKKCCSRKCSTSLRLNS